MALGVNLLCASFVIFADSEMCPDCRNLSYRIGNTDDGEHVILKNSLCNMCKKFFSGTQYWDCLGIGKCTKCEVECCELWYSISIDEPNFGSEEAPLCAKCALKRQCPSCGDFNKEEEFNANSLCEKCHKKREFAKLKYNFIGQCEACGTESCELYTLNREPLCIKCFCTKSRPCRNCKAWGPVVEPYGLCLPCWSQKMIVFPRTWWKQKL